MRLPRLPQTGNRGRSRARWGGREANATEFGQAEGGEPRQQRPSLQAEQLHPVPTRAPSPRYSRGGQEVFALDKGRPVFLHPIPWTRPSPAQPETLSPSSRSNTQPRRLPTWADIGWTLPQASGRHGRRSLRHDCRTPHNRQWEKHCRHLRSRKQRRSPSSGWKCFFVRTSLPEVLPPILIEIERPE